MAINNFMLPKRLPFVSLLNLLLLMGVLTPVFAQETTPANGETIGLRLLRDTHQLALLIPGDAPLALDTFAYQVTTRDGLESHALRDYGALRIVLSSAFPIPACFVLRDADSAAPLPVECANLPTDSVHIQELAAPDRFWFDPVANQPYLITVIDGVAPVALCPAELTTCNIDFPHRDPPASALADPDEVLILIARFRIINNTYDPQLEWEIVLDDAISELNDTVNARVELVPTILESQEEAQALSDRYGATLVIWGRVRAAAVETFYTFTPRSVQLDAAVGESRTSFETLDQLAFYITAGGDSEYILQFVLAQIAYLGPDSQESMPYLNRALELAPPERAASLNAPALYFYRAYLNWESAQTSNSALSLLQSARDDNQAALALLDSAQETPSQMAGMLRMNLGTAYADLFKLGHDPANFDGAIAAYQDALEVFTADTSPGDYAMVQNNLGISYLERSIVEDPLTYNRLALIAFQEAIRFRDPAVVPFEYAETQTSIGNALFLRAHLEQPEENYPAAIAAYEEALRYRTPESAPLEYARTIANLGLSYYAVGEISDACSALTSALEIYRAQQITERISALENGLVIAGCKPK